jgi:hypothetical protein
MTYIVRTQPGVSSTPKRSYKVEKKLRTIFSIKQERNKNKMTPVYVDKYFVKIALRYSKVFKNATIRQQHPYKSINASVSFLEPKSCAKHKCLHVEAHFFFLLYLVYNYTTITTSIKSTLFYVI